MGYATRFLLKFSSSDIEDSNDPDQSTFVTAVIVVFYK